MHYKPRRKTGERAEERHSESYSSAEIPHPRGRLAIPPTSAAVPMSSPAHFLSRKPCALLPPLSAPPSTMWRLTSRLVPALLPPFHPRKAPGPRVPFFLGQGSDGTSEKTDDIPCMLRNISFRHWSAVISSSSNNTHVPDRHENILRGVAKRWIPAASGGGMWSPGGGDIEIKRP
jgi:hypothetical protein